METPGQQVEPFDERALERALTWYQRAVEQEPDNYYPRINVATLLLIRGHQAKSREEASATVQKIELCPLRDHWWLATKGEAILLMGTTLKARRDSTGDWLLRRL